MSRAVVVHAASDVRVEEVADAAPAAREAVIAVAYGGLCGSDLHYAAEGASGAYVIGEPLVLGHEIVGTVSSVGSAVVEVAPGDRVVVHPASTCGACEACTGGRSNLCPSLRYLGSASTTPHTQGGFRDALVVDASRARPIPSSLPTRTAVLAEPLAVVLHALGRAGGAAGLRVHVTGSGPIGALAVAAARAQGAAAVTVSDPAEAARDVASAVGADAVFDAGDGPVEADLGVEASGSPAALADLVARASPGGTVLVVSNMRAGSVEVPLSAMAAKELTLVTSLRFSDEIDEAISLLASGLDVSALLTHEFDVEDAVEALRTASDRSTGSSKVLLAFGRPG